jgi:hypothetical protein
LMAVTTHSTGKCPPQLPRLRATAKKQHRFSELMRPEPYQF